MVGFALIVVGCAVLTALLANPKIGVLLVWPVIFIYPHLYMARLALLPWNIGVDDLFICVFFVVVVVRRNFLGGTPFRFGLTMWGALTYLMIWTIANLSGWLIMPEALPEEILKPILKYVILVLFAYAMVHTIDDERDLVRSGYAFVISLTLAGATVILHKLFPYQMLVFTSEEVVLQTAWHGGVVERAVGSLVSANVGCAIMGMVVIFAICFGRAHSRLFVKLALFGCIPVLLLGMLLTGSRTGAAALGATLLVMGVLSRARVYVWMLILGIVLAVALKPEVFHDFQQRLTAVYNPEGGGQLDPNAQTRVDLWRAYWESSTPQIWLFGQGRLVPTLMLGMHTHSTYVAALFNHGIGGVVWMLLFFGCMTHRALKMIRGRLEPYRTIGSAVVWGLCAWAVAGLTLDMIVSGTPRFVCLFYAVLIERSYALAMAASATRAPSAEPTYLAADVDTGLPA